VLHKGLSFIAMKQNFISISEIRAWFISTQQVWIQNYRSTDALGGQEAPQISRRLGSDMELVTY
jgi:hypothetical protein